MINKTLNYLNFIKDYIRNNIKPIIFISSIIIILLLLFLKLNKDRNELIKKYEYNINALNDSLRVYKGKNGSVYYEKSLFEYNFNELKKYNKELYDDIQKLKDDNKRIKDNLIKFILKLDTKIENKDTIYIKNIEPIKTNFGLRYLINYDTVYTQKDYLNFNGDFEIDTITKKGNFKLNNLSVGMSLKLLVYDDTKNNKLNLMVKSDNPNFKILDINGSTIDLKKYNNKRFGLSTFIGYGFCINNNTIKPSPVIGVGLSYNIIKF